VRVAIRAAIIEAARATDSVPWVELDDADDIARGPENLRRDSLRGG
jgi:hypothetical protein